MIKTILTITALLLVTPELFAQNVTIRGVRLTGSGCNNSTATAAVTDDGLTMSVLFDNYATEIGVGSENPNLNTLTKNCRVLIDVDVPDGYQYALETTTYRGFAALPASAHGFHRFTQVLNNQTIPSLREAQLRGPVGNNYEVVVASKPGRVPYSTCHKAQQTIELISELMVSFLPRAQDRSKAMINLDSVDTGVNSSFKLGWRRCN